MGRAHQKGARVSDDGLYPPKAYKAGHVFILDDVDTNAPAKRICGRQRLTEHHYKCDLIRDLWEVQRLRSSQCPISARNERTKFLRLLEEGTRIQDQR